MKYSERLSLLYALCLNDERDAGRNPSTIPSANLQDYEPLEAANYLACYLAFKAIQQAERSPADERLENFDMLSVYHAFAMLMYAYLMLPLADEGIAPDTEATAVVVARTLFSGLSDEELAEIIESGAHKFRLIAETRQEYWTEYRERLDKTVIAFLVAGTDAEAPFEKEEVLPMLGGLLSMLCEAFEH